MNYLILFIYYFFNIKRFLIIIKIQINKIINQFLYVMIKITKRKYINNVCIYKYKIF